MTNTQQRYRFGDFTLDLGQHRLWRAGKPVRTGKLTFDFLRVLVQAAPNVVTQAELIDSVWGPRRIVTPETLAKRVMLLRQAIGDDAVAPRYVEAVRGIGYRLVAPVATLDAPRGDVAPTHDGLAAKPAAPSLPARPPARVAFWVVVACVAIATLTAYVVSLDPRRPAAAVAREGTAATALAVLPFVNLSSDAEDEYFAAGLSEELLGRIAAIDTVAVMSRASALALRASAESPTTLGARYGIDQIIEGTLRRDGERLRIDVRLVDTARGVALWSQTFDRTVGDAFATQEDIARAVANVLSLRLRSRSTDGRYGGTDSFEAYEQYLRGMATWNVEPPRAVEAFERALAIDPDYRQPWHYLTYAYGWVLETATTLEAERALSERMEHAGRRAVEALPDSWEGHSALGWLLVSKRDWLGADAAQETARRLAAAAGAPRAMLRPYALYMGELGELEESLRLLEQRRQADPLDFFTLNNLQNVLILLDRSAEARTIYERTAGVPGVRDRVAEFDIPWLIAQGDERQISAALASASPRVQALAGVWHSPHEALRVLREALHAPGYHARSDYSKLAVFAGHYGDPELAVLLLREAFLGGGYAAYREIWHPALGAARRTEAFERFVRELGLVDLWRHRGDWGDYCRPSGPDDFECV